MSKSIEFEVTGHGAFPVDMLRYDSCYPAKTEDAISIVMNIHDSGIESYRAERTVRLIALAIPHIAQQYRITVARWESHGWRVTKERKF